MTPLDEALARVAQGDRGAFDAVFDAAWPRTLAWCALSWILTIAAFEVRTVRQRRRRDQARVASLDALDAGAQPADPVTGADDALIDAESADELARLLDELSPDDRALVEDALAGRAPVHHGRCPRRRRPRARAQRPPGQGKLRPPQSGPRASFRTPPNSRSTGPGQSISTTCHTSFTLGVATGPYRPTT